MRIKNLKNRIASVFSRDPSKKLECEICKEMEIRRLERPNGRRAFFRGVAGAVGITAFKEKIPKAFGDEGGWGHTTDWLDGNQSENWAGCTNGHHEINRYYPNTNRTHRYCHHSFYVVDSATKRMVCDRNGNRLDVAAGNNIGGHWCRNETVIKGNQSVRTWVCTANNSAAHHWNTKYPGSYVSDGVCP